MSSSSNDEFEDPYNDISNEETAGPLEVVNTDTIQGTMPNENESKPNKSICRSLSAHLGLLKSRVNELSTFLDEREAVQAIVEDEVESIRQMARWIESKFSKIVNQWEEFLETEYDDTEHDQAIAVFNECDDLSSKIKGRAYKFIREKVRGAI